MGDECNISDEEVRTIVRNHLGNEAEIVNYLIKPATDNVLGFMGDHVRILATALLNGEEKKVQYFGKKIPTKIKSHRDYAEGTRMFYKEIELFKTLFVDMKNAASAKRRDLKWRPECYLTRDYELVIVEDLSVQDYYMPRERTFMDMESLKIAIKSMAKMHASSIIFEEKLNAGLCSTLSTRFTPGQENVTIRDLYPNLVFESECTDEPGHVGYNFWEVGIRSHDPVIDLLPGYTSEEKEKIKKSFPDAIRQVYRMVEPSDKFRNVMIHADLWGNNLLFRDKDGKVSEAIILDFQIVRYAPPAQDLFMLLHIVQNKPFRDEYEADMVDLYYSYLSEELAAEGLDISILLPRQEFDESCIYYKRYAVLTQLTYVQINYIPSEIATKFMSTPESYDKVMHRDRSEVIVECFNNDEFCRDRIIECMQEIIEQERLL